MDIHRIDPASPGDRAPESGFVGDVRIRTYVRRPSPSRLTEALVTFAPGSRTAWKVNPTGQTIVVTGGAGRAQTEGGPVVEIGPGDLLWFAPGERHWEGAAPDAELSYVAVQEETPGASVQFGAAVTDREYRLLEK